MQRVIDRDPYKALFGRRLEPFMDIGRHRSWSDFYRAFLGLGPGTPVGRDGNGKTADTTARLKTDGDRSAEESAEESRASTEADVSKSKDGTESELEFDPISGRMTPKARVVDVDGLDVSDQPNPSDTVEKTTDANGGPDPSSDPLTQTSKEHQRKHRRTLWRKGKGKELADVTHGFPEVQNLQASDTSRNALDEDAHRQIVAEASNEQSDMSPEHAASSGEAGKKLPADSPVVDMNETQEASVFQTERDTVSRAKSEYLWEQMEKDLELLSASDIRASYDSRRPDPDPASEKQEVRRALEHELEAYVDPASEVDAHEVRERHEDPSEMSGEPSSTPTAEGNARVVEQAQEVNTEPEPNTEPPNTEPALSRGLDQVLDQAPDASTSPAVYRILAYDSSTMQMTRAEASSSNAANEILHPTEVLSRLNNPAKFLPHFASMHNNGYEIVSGGGDILVFKKVRTAEKPGEASSAPGSYDAGYSSENAPFAEHNQVGSKPQQPPGTVRRHETVYTGGPPNWSPYPPPTHGQPVPETDIPLPKRESTLRKLVRRMLLAGGVTAASCVAIGVVSEFFRTGGQDGHGTDGFTEFESERRGSK